MTTAAADKRKRGRPATGQTPVVGIRLEGELIEEIDAWAAAQGLSRSKAIRQLIAKAMKRKRS